MAQIRNSIDALEGSAAPPRKNGELIFEAPWQSRAFGMAVALQGQGAFSWGEFSAGLAASESQDESQVTSHKSQAGAGRERGAVLPAAADAEREYYERWLEALEELLVEKGLLSHQELEARTAEFAAGMWDDQH